MRNQWSNKEIFILIKKYPLVGAKGLVNILLRTSEAINIKANRLGLKSGIRSARRYTVNEKIFSTKTLKECYWAGFIAADGCITTSKVSINQQKALEINLHIKDEKHLQKFKKFMQSNYPIIRNKQFATRIRINSDKICDNLKNIYNITPRKSLTLRPPNNLNFNQSLSFIKGYVDGDGSIYTMPEINRFALKFTGTKMMLNWIQKILSKREDISNLKIYKIKHAKNTYELVITGKRARKVVKLLNDSVEFGLERKWQKLNQ